MSGRRDETGFRHGLRVRLGEHGPKGQLLKCEKRDGTGHYWKVKLATGEWVWPDNVIMDGPGETVERCLDCRMRFMGDISELLCPACQGDAFGTNPDRGQAAQDDHYARRTGTYHRKRSHF